MKAAVLLASLLALAVTAAGAAEKPLSAKRMATLLASGKTIKITGAGDHYSGTLVLTADGKGTGEGKTADGRAVTFAGTWQLKRNRFCHQWNDIEKAEVCEVWVPIEPKKAAILVKRTEVGIVTWE